MPFLANTDWRACGITLLLGLVGAVTGVLLNIPLPWMIGPLVATAIAGLRDVKLNCPTPLREAGQWAIGTTLGLYFTPAVIAVLASYVGFIIAGILFALALGMVCGWALHKLSGVDKTTAFFAAAIGGASEMASQGERHGALVDRVAAAHSLRIMLVVAVIPFGFQFAGVKGLDPFLPGTQVVDYIGLAAVIALTSIAALSFKRLSLPNAWIIGPLAIMLVLTALEIDLSAIPRWMIYTGQLFIGVSLGTRFKPDFLSTAGRYMLSVAACTLVAILIAIGFALTLAYFSGMNPATAILATSPGGVAEMSLTAETLQLGVPIVTAFHVTRMVALVMTIGPLFELIKYLSRRTATSNASTRS